MFCNSWQLGISYKIHNKIPSIGILYIMAFLSYRDKKITKITKSLSCLVLSYSLILSNVCVIIGTRPIGDLT